MIVQCEKCLTKYNLDESLIKDGGSKVRCSRCKHAFIMYPQEQAPPEELEIDLARQDEFEETVALDSPPVLEGEAAESGAEKPVVDFGEGLEEAKEEKEAAQGNGFEEVAEELVDESFMKEEPLEKEFEREVTEGGEGDFEAVRATPSRKRFGLSRLLLVILVIFLLVAGGAAAMVFWAPDLLPDSLSMLKPAKQQAVRDLGVRRLSFKGVTGSFVDSKKAGNLFVIRGMVTNDYQKSRSFILVKGSILNDKGAVVKEKEAYAGNAFTEEEIRDRPMEEINEAMKNRSGMGRKNISVGPGESVPFMIVFENLPDNLSEFTIEAVRSSPGA